MAEEFDGLSWALKALRDDERQGGYREAYRYYEGEHQLMFATEKFKSIFGKKLAGIVDNLCPAVVDSIADRLKITGVGFDEANGGTAELAQAAWEVWQRNRMDVRAPETHHEALLTGDGYALVWPNKVGEAVVWSIPACDAIVAYDPNAPGLIRRAARQWFDEDDGRVHVDLFFPDHVERYVSRARKRSLGEGASRASGYTPYQPTDVEGEEVLDNPWGRVPLFHFPNRRYHAYGISELANVIPMQNSLNKTLCDRHVAQEFAAFRQRWATGLDSGELDEQGKPKNPVIDYGADRMFTSPDPETRFGDFQATELGQYTETAENDRAEIARVSGTPLHYLFITRGDFPSGEAMKSAEARFTRKVEQRQTAYGNQWEDLLAFALRVEGHDAATGQMLSLEWEPASPTAGDAGEPVAAAPLDEPDDSLARSAAQPR